MILNIGDKVQYRHDNKLYQGVIKSIQGDKIEIDDDTVELVVVSISKGTIADKLEFTSSLPKSKFKHTQVKT